MDAFLIQLGNQNNRGVGYKFEVRLMFYKQDALKLFTYFAIAYAFSLLIAAFPRLISEYSVACYGLK
jgi:hypothetical protein